MSPSSIRADADHGEPSPDTNASAAKSPPNGQTLPADHQALSCPEIIALTEHHSQMQRDQLGLQRFAMALQMDHSEEIKTLTRQTQGHAAELDRVKQAVKGDLWGLQHQIDVLRTQTAELADSVAGVVAVKPEWRDSNTTDQIAAAGQTQVDFHAATATKMREERAALLKGEGRDRGEDRGGELMQSLERGEGELEARTSCHVPESHLMDGATDVKKESKLVAMKPKEESTKSNLGTPKTKDVALGNVGRTQGVGAPSTHELSGDGPASGFPTSSADHSTTTTTTSWMPLAVRQMPKTAVSDQSHNTETFCWEHIRQTLGGEQWSPGFHFVSEDSVLPSKSYWILEGEYEPFLPSAPGQHGAKLTAFFNNTGCTDIDGFPDETNYLGAPVFIRAANSREYIYYGEYSQLRFSDKLDYDRMMDGSVPVNVRRYWAQQLSEQGRPAWVTNALMEHFWPQPTYHGAVPRAGTEAGDQQSQDADKAAADSLTEHVRLLSEWQKTARVKVSLLSSAALMDAFAKADADEEPGLRLWWEYLQCVGYDQGFYDMMVEVKYLETSGGSAKSVASLRSRRPETVAAKVNGQRRMDVAAGFANGGSAGHSTSARRPNLGGDTVVAKQLRDEHRLSARFGTRHTSRLAVQGDDKGGESDGKQLVASVPPHLRKKQ